MIGIHLIAPLRHAVVPRCDHSRKDDGRIALVERDEHQRLVGTGRSFGLDGDDACLRGLDHQECTVSGQSAEGCLFRELCDQRLFSTIGRWHLRGQQAGIAGVPCPGDLAVVGRAQCDDDAIERDGRAVVAAVG